MEFSHLGKDILLQGVQPAPLSVQEISLHTMGKWLAGNEVWALAVVDPAAEQTVEDAPPVEVHP